MEHWQMRTEALLGPDAVQRMAKSRVLLFGVGGVGAACAEALARGGVGDITLVDPDVVCESNLNRQVVALRSNLGRYKAEAMADRIRDINPHCRVQVYCMFYGAENADSIEFSGYDYVIDAIDSVASKLLLVEKCMACGTPVISSMGTGGKLDPGKLRIADIYETETCPLARVMRRELRRRNIRKLDCVFSPEEPTRRPEAGTTIGTVSFVPPVAGYLLAGYVIRKLAEA